MDKVRQDLADFNFTQKYARFRKDKSRRETWDEATVRIKEMHLSFYEERLRGLPKEARQELLTALSSASRAEGRREILSSQRARQFGGVPVLKKNWRIYNCTVSFADRTRFFQEAFWLLLCGCGVGFSVQRHHVGRLPMLLTEEQYAALPEKNYVIPDTIEGWADSLGELLYSWWGFTGTRPVFDFSEIRKKGAALSAGGKAPGPDPLKIALERVHSVMVPRAGQDLRPIDAFDVVMHTSDAVLSGGVRRAATIAVFSLDDEEMAQSKTGNWYTENPQRARANISALVPLNEPGLEESFLQVMENTKQWGEPGVIFAASTEHLYNPCVEIGMCPLLILDDEGDVLGTYTLDHLENRAEYEDMGFIYETGWQACNLTEVNCAAAKTEMDLYSAIAHATVLGTFQAGYTKSEYLGRITERIVEREALLGVSLTGMSNNPDLAFNEDTLREGAELAVSVNKKIARLLGLNQASRVTCVKPSGNAAVLLGCASGIHPEHARKFIRRVQVARSNPVAQYFELHNPDAIEDSVWSPPGADDICIAFPVEVDEKAIVKADQGALDFLDRVMLVQENWVNAGTAVDRVEGLSHNVSNTCLVSPDEWEEVPAALWKNRHTLTGVSLLGSFGDYGYAQPPFQAIYEPREFAELGFSAEEIEQRRKAWDLWRELRANWFSPDYSVMVEDTDTTTPQAEGACVGGSCEFKPGS